ncbi:MAG: multiheme c-type cytochrome [Planctomycetota bacterium]|nr:multiheme c-type cytochrome [Planctomycetota bacterium]
MRPIVFASCLLLASCQQPAHDPAPAGGGGGGGAGVTPFAMGTPDVVLLVTGQTKGVLEPCYCAGEMFGGFARRATLVRRYRRAFPHTMLIDTGDAFAMGAPGDPRNHFVVRGYQQIGYDALVLGYTEWMTPGLDQLVAQRGVTYLSTNVATAGASKVVKRRWGGVKLAVLSELDRDSRVLQEGRMRGLKMAPAGALAKRVAALERDGYAVALVVNGNDGAVRRAARHGADLVVQGRFTAKKATLRAIGDARAARTGGYDYVSAFALRIRAGKITDVEHRYERVDKRWPNDSKLLDTYYAYSKTALKHAQQTKRSDGLAYVASAACAKCHKEQYEGWKAFRHAHAYQTLFDVERASDPDCLRCHTTGLTSTRGFYSMEKTPGLANVNCQDCHAVELAAHSVTPTAPAVTEATCTRCHTSTTDPKFDYKTRRAHVGCCAK